jgi:UDP-N-acetylglucosamine transferase subunit ALG13
MLIFVTLGTHPMSFERLVRELDDLIARKKINAKIMAQIGSTAKSFQPKHFAFTDLLPPDKLTAEIRPADLVISHGGAGSIITALSLGKKVVVVPRRKKFLEHTDDHQIELCEALARKKKVICVKEIKELETAIRQSKSFSFNKSKENNVIGKTIGLAFKKWF